MGRALGSVRPLPVVSGPTSWIGADLRGVDLSGRDLRGSDMSEADLTGAKLVGTDLRGATLFGTNLTDAELLGARLDGAVLDGCSAERAGFGRCSLEGASMMDADLRGATLGEANLRGADLRAARLDGARLVGADLTGAELVRASLKEVHLEDSKVAGSTFDRADMRGATVRGIEGFESARFVRADIRDVDFAGAYLFRRHVLDQNYLEEFRTRDRLHGVIYEIWRVTSDCGRSVTRWAVWTLLLMVAFAVAFQFVGLDYGEHPTWASPYYYSAVTLTTLGYGDVLPTTAAAQLLAVLEVTCGYMMLGGLLSIMSNKMARRAD